MRMNGGRRLVLILGTLLATTAARAQVPELPLEPGAGNLKLGAVRVHPFVSLGELYDDNVFLQPRGAQDDFITVISPGTFLVLPLGRHQFSVGYRADILVFADLGSQDTVRHYGHIELTGKYPGGLSWFIEDEPKRTNERPDTEFDPLIDRDQNDGRAGAEYAFADRWAIGAEYGNRLFNYANQQPTVLADGTVVLRSYGTDLDRMEQLGTATLYYLVQPKTAVLGEFGYGDTSYFARSTAAQRDNSIVLGRVGVRGDLTSKLTAQVKVGYGRKDLDNPTRPDFDGVIASGSVTYLLQERTRFILTVDRSMPESSFRGDDFYISSGFALRGEHAFTAKVRMYAEGGYANHDYKSSDRTDDYYAAGVGAQYQIQDYLGVSAEYLFERRDSNLDLDYDDNRVFLRVTAAL